MKDMTGKVALVTGAGSGIGEAIVRRFCLQSARVGMIGRREHLLQTLAEETGAIPLPGDVADPESVKQAVDELVLRCDRLDIVINNAATTGRGSVDQLDNESWNRTIEVNVSGAFHVARVAVPYLKEQGGGTIVNVSSIGALFGAPNAAAYATTKAALLGLTRAMARDHGPDGIRVNTICPGWVETPMAEPVLDLLMQKYNLSRDQARKHLTQFNPIDGMATPDEIARCVEFLATDASACVTGTILMADNGQSIVDVGFIPIQLAMSGVDR